MAKTERKVSLFGIDDTLAGFRGSWHSTSCVGRSLNFHVCTQATWPTGAVVAATVSGLFESGDEDFGVVAQLDSEL